MIELRDVSKEQAGKEILEYISEKGKAWTDEIADDLSNNRYCGGERDTEGIG